MTNEKKHLGADAAEVDEACSLVPASTAPHAAPNYTPGPWTWFTGLFTDGQQDRTGDRMRYIVGADGQGFAHTVGLNPTRDSANADLIAAAPELLAYAKSEQALADFQCPHDATNMRRMCETCGWEWSKLLHVNEKMRAAAIRKAEGR